jgi:c-di-GMP-binding flagellar brake protein YcgR
MAEHTPAHPSEKRRSPRLHNQHATSLFGEVFDLSAGGMKVFRKSSKLVEMGEEFTVDLQCEHLSASLRVRVVHRECVGFHRHVYGVEFVGVDDGLRAKIGRLIDAACEPCACPSCWIAA